MKQKVFAVISVVLVLCLMLSTGSFAYERYVSPALPTIYIVGQGQELTKVAGAGQTKGTIYPIEADSDYITEQAKIIAPALAKAAVTDDWSEYNDAVYNAVAPLFADVKCNNDGEVTDGSGSAFQNVGIKPQTKYSSAPIYQAGINGYSMCYDWRLDPYELAKELRDMVIKITTRKKTDKVNIVARCLGANIVMAYIDLYGDEDLMLNKVILYSSGIQGFEIFGALFSGEIDFDTDAIESFSNGYLQSEDYAQDSTYETVRALLSMVNKLTPLNLSDEVINRGYADVKSDLMPRVLIDTVANMPSFWSYVGEEYYEEAKKLIFTGKEEQYAKLIEKIDNYHYNVMCKTDELLQKADDKGTQFYIIAKYGLALVPLRSSFNGVQSDTFASTEVSSLGATCSGLMNTFNKAYLQNAEKNGTAQYIAPDNQIDASTCRYPERTWFIKNLAHRTMPECVNPIIQYILMEDNATVFSSEEYPQYFVVNDEATEMTPMVKENADTQKKNEISFWEALRTLFNSLKAYIKNMFTPFSTK